MGKYACPCLLPLPKTTGKRTCPCHPVRVRHLIPHTITARVKERSRPSAIILRGGEQFSLPAGAGRSYHTMRMAGIPTMPGTPAPDALFERAAVFDPAGDFEAFLKQAPAKWVVYLLADAD